MADQWDELLLLGAVLLGLDVLAAAIRAAFINANAARLAVQRDQGAPHASQALALLHAPQPLWASLNLIQVLLRFSLAGTLLALTGLLPEPGLTAWAVWGILVLAAAFVFGVEWAIESVIAQKPEVWAMRLIPIARTLIFVLTPLLVLPLALKRKSSEDQEPAGAVTEDELKIMVDAGHHDGVLETDEREMIYSIFKLSDTLAREIMVPRIYMTTLDVNTPINQTLDALLQSGNSRVPVYAETIDKVIGLLYAKDLLRVFREGSQLDSLRSLLRPAYFVPEAKRVDDLLSEMQTRRIQMAIVVDEYGGVAGLVTMEDIVEEIVGEIHDEYDQLEESPYQVTKEGDFIFQGRIDLGSFNELMGSRLPDEEADTLGGLIYSHLGRVPAIGDHVIIDNLVLSVEQVSGRRIRKIRATRVLAEPEVENDEPKPVNGRDA